MQTRRCITCKQIKPLNEFNFRRQSTGERHTHCRDCQRVYKQRFYLKHRDAYLLKSARQKQDSIRRNRTRVRAYLGTHPCVDCGESDVAVLEFDHTREKDRAIADMVQAGVSWQRILKEIQKCKVRCGNCHKKKTARQNNWYKHLGL